MKKQNLEIMVQNGIKNGMSVSAITDMLEEKGYLKKGNRSKNYDTVRGVVRRIQRSKPTKSTTRAYANGVTKTDIVPVEEPMVTMEGDDVVVNVPAPTTGYNACSDTSWEKAIREAGLNPANFCCKGVRITKYPMQIGNGETIEATATRFTLERLPNLEIGDVEAILTEDVLEKINGMNEKAKLMMDENGDIVILLPVADAHITTLRQALMLLGNITTKVVPFLKKYYFNGSCNVVKIAVMYMGDLVHYNSDNHCTAKGTYVGGEGTLESATAAAYVFVQKLTDLLLEEFDVPVEQAYVRGNHDTFAGLTVIRQLAAYYAGRGETRVSFNLPKAYTDSTCKLNPHFGWIQCGRAAVVFGHGDHIPKNTPNVPLLANPNAYREADFFIGMFGHKHKLEMHAMPDMDVYQVPTCESGYDPYATKLAFITRPAFLPTVVFLDRNRASTFEFPIEDMEV